jgi:predicted Zn-ribbon and HTH transcriptional regulator
LARHQSALTLLHRVGERKTSSLPYGCKFCGYYFSTMDHLELHSNQSSCGKRRSGFSIPDDECLICSAPNIVDGVPHETLFPKHISSPSKRLNMQHICSKCGLYFISEEIVAEHTKHSFCTRFERERGRERDGSLSLVDEGSSHDHILPSKRTRLSKEDSNELRASPLSSNDQQTSLRRTKRIKHIIPAGAILSSFFSLPSSLHPLLTERKALYSLCSLYVDKSKIKNDNSFTITTDNILDYIQDEKLPLIQKLMEYVPPLLSLPTSFSSFQSVAFRMLIVSNSSRSS